MVGLLSLMPHLLMPQMKDVIEYMLAMNQVGGPACMATCAHRSLRLVGQACWMEASQWLCEWSHGWSRQWSYGCLTS